MVEYLNKNSTINYPFKEEVSLRDILGFKLNKNFVIGAKFYGAKLNQEHVLSVDLTNVDYFISSIISTGPDYLQLVLTEVYREVYNSSDPTTYTHVGDIYVPKNVTKGSSFMLVPRAEVTLEGVITCGEVDTHYLTGVHTFDYPNTKFEDSVFVPVSGNNPLVATLGAMHSGVSMFNDITLQEGTDVTLNTNVTTNSIKINLEFVEEECPECEYPTVFKINGVTPDQVGNFIIKTKPPLSVSSYQVLKDGGDPAEPKDWASKGLVISYHGPILTAVFDRDSVNPYRTCTVPEISEEHPEHGPHNHTGLDCCLLECHDLSDLDQALADGNTEADALLALLVP